MILHIRKDRAVPDHAGLWVPDSLRLLLRLRSPLARPVGGKASLACSTPSASRCSPGGAPLALAACRTPARVCSTSTAPTALPERLHQSLAALPQLPRCQPAVVRCLSPAARPALQQSLARCVCGLSLRVRPVTRSPVLPGGTPSSVSRPGCRRGAPPSIRRAWRGLPVRASGGTGRKVRLKFLSMSIPQIIDEDVRDVSADRIAMFKQCGQCRLPGEFVEIGDDKERWR